MPNGSIVFGLKKMSLSQKSTVKLGQLRRFGFPASILSLIGCTFFVLAGCRTVQTNQTSFEGESLAGYQDYLTTIEYPEVDESTFQSAQEAMSTPPLTVSEYTALDFQDLTLDEAIRMAMTNSKIISKLGGQIVSTPAAASSVYDPAVQETNPIGGVEGALSSFDARWDTAFNFTRSETKFNNLFFGGGVSNLISNASNFDSAVTKQTTFGGSYGIRNTINYNRNNSPVNRFASTFDMIVQAEFRQSLLRGAGTMVNQVAGPNSTPGIYNGVLIARINQDISHADFEASVRDLVREVERNYWELWYAYRNLDNLMDARESARETWEKRELRTERDKPFEKPQARQQYFSFQRQVETALAGNGINRGVYGSERELRRLCGLNAADGSILRPSSDPVIAKLEYDWDELQVGAMESRVELRRQQWTIKQRELEFLASKNLNRWQLDFLANYGWKGFGDNLAGSRNRPEGSALEDLWSGDLDDWTVGFEFGGPIGKRQTFLAVKNAELQLAKARAILREQQRQVVLDLNGAFTEVDRAYQGIKTIADEKIAVEEELKIREIRFNGGLPDEMFFFFDAQRRVATTESAFVRAIADYNLALVDVAYQSGGLLERYGIQLAEGPWSEDAYANAAERDLRYSGQ